MGINVELYVEVDELPANIHELRNDFVEMCPGWWFGNPDNPNPDDGAPLEFDNDPWLPRPRITAPTCMRVWTPGYGRGDWPKILTAIAAMQASFPGLDVHYGGDNEEDCPVVDAAMLGEYTAVWWEVQIGARGAYAPTASERRSLPIGFDHG